MNKKEIKQLEKKELRNKTITSLKRERTKTLKRKQFWKGQYDNELDERIRLIDEVIKEKGEDNE